MSTPAEQPTTTFAALGLSPPLLHAISDLGHVAPTPVQEQVIPSIVKGRDVWASAPTGSGKTAAFVLPMLELLAIAEPSALRPRPLRALVLVPTRELAAQIGDSIDRYGRHLVGAQALVTRTVVGGLSINPQMLALRGGADIVVATPGRLLDLVDKNALRLSEVELLVLDEADRMLSLGFAEELSRVLDLVPRCQRLLFSATFPPAVRELATSLLEDPLRVAVDGGASLGDVQALTVQRAIEVDTARRTMLLRHLLTEHAWPSVLVFVASRYTSEHVTDKLRRAEIAAAPFHGDLSQGARTQALEDFRARRVQVLVATDVASRGIDVAGLPAVVNYDLPRSPVDYLHRIGRTGRAGEAGEAISFVSATTEAHLRLIEKRHRITLPRERIVGFEPTEVAPLVLDAHGGIKGARKSKKDKLREAGKR